MKSTFCPETASSVDQRPERFSPLRAKVVEPPTNRWQAASASRLKEAVFASLLPGLRELRAPLTAGYLWLVAGWIIFVRAGLDEDVGRSQAANTLASIRDELGPAGTAAAVSFGAFILGAIWEAAVAAVFRSASVRLSTETSNAVPALGERWFRNVDDVVQARLGPTDGRWVEAIASSIDPEQLTLDRERLWSGDTNAPRSHPLSPQYDRMEKAWLSLEVASPRDAWWQAADPDLGGRVAFGEIWGRLLAELMLAVYNPTGRPLGIPETGRSVILSGFKRARDEFGYVITTEDIGRRIIEELPLTARRLVGEQQELYLELDRIKAEIDFRFAVAVPLAVLAVAVGVSLPTGLAIACVLLGLVVMTVLIWDGVRRDRERNDVLVDLMRSDKAVTPTFMRLRDRAQAIPADMKLPPGVT